MRRSNCASALQYVPELTWILFLRILDAQEQKAREEAEALGNDYAPALTAPYRWQDWAAPFSDKKIREFNLSAGSARNFTRRATASCLSLSITNCCRICTV